MIKRILRNGANRFKRSVQRNNPYILRLASKVTFLLLSLAMVINIFMTNRFDFILAMPTFYIIGNLLLETILYRFFKLKESHFQSKRIVRTKFKITLDQLDKAALKTNTVKWVTFCVCSILGSVAFFMMEWNAEIIWISINAYGLVSIFVFGLCQEYMKDMPYVSLKNQKRVLNFEPYKKGISTMDPSTSAGFTYFTNHVWYRPKY